jgi:hypothetical protein
LGAAGGVTVGVGTGVDVVGLLVDGGGVGVEPWLLQAFRVHRPSRAAASQAVPADRLNRPPVMLQA